jgi:2,3-bisphosphoglycerate-independent phosphoglycerate mutase
MVGHNGDIEATVVACKATDEAVKVRVITYILLSTIFDDLLMTQFFIINHSNLEQVILDVVEQVGGIYLATADHGNAEDMVKRNKSGQPQLDKSGAIQILTSHTLQPVSVKCN